MTSVTIQEVTNRVTVQENAAGLVTLSVEGPQGPQGPQGPAAASVKIEASLASTWVLANPLGRIPTVSVYLSNGEQIIADVASTPSQITITHAQPQQGYVVAF